MADEINTPRKLVRAMAAKDFWINAGPRNQGSDREGGEAYGSGDTSTAPRKAPAFRTFLSGNPTSSVGRLASKHYMASHKPDMTQRAVYDQFEAALKSDDIKTVRQSIIAGRKMSHEAYAERSDIAGWVMVGRNEGEALAMREVIDALLEQFPADVDPKMKTKSFPLEVDGRKSDISFEEAERDQRPLPREMNELDLQALLTRIADKRSEIEPKAVALVTASGMDNQTLSKIVASLPKDQAVSLTMSDAQFKTFSGAHKTMYPSDSRVLARMNPTDKEINAAQGVVVVYDGNERSRAANRVVKSAQRGSLVGAYDMQGAKLDRISLSVDLEPMHLTEAQQVRSGTIPAFDLPISSPHAAAALDMLRRNRTAGVNRVMLSEKAKDAILSQDGKMSLNEAIERASRLEGGLGLSTDDRDILSHDETLHQARLSFTSMQKQLADHGVALVGRDQMPVALRGQDGPRYLYAKGDISFGAEASAIVGMISDDVSNPAAEAARNADLDAMRKSFLDQGMVIAEVEGMGNAPISDETRRILILPRGHAAGSEADIQRATQIADNGGVVYSTMPPESTLVGYAQRDDGRAEKHFAEVGVTSREISKEEFKKEYGKTSENNAVSPEELQARKVTDTLKAQAARIADERQMAVAGKGKAFEQTLMARAASSGLSPLEAYERVNAKRAGLDIDTYRVAQEDKQFALSQVDPGSRATYRANVEARAVKAGLNIAEAWEKVAAQKAGVSSDEYAVTREQIRDKNEAVTSAAYEKRATALGITVDQLRTAIETTCLVKHVPAPAPALKSGRDIARLDGVVSAKENGKPEPTPQEARFASAMRIPSTGIDRDLVKTAFAQMAHHGMKDAVAELSTSLQNGEVSKEAIRKLMHESGRPVGSDKDLPKGKDALNATLSRVTEDNLFLAKRANRRATQHADYAKAKEFAASWVEQNGKISAFKVFTDIENEDRSVAKRERLEQKVGKTGKSIQKRAEATATPASMNAAARHLARISDQMVIGSAHEGRSQQVAAAVATMVEHGKRPVVLRPKENGKDFAGTRRLLEGRGVSVLENIGATATDLERIDAKNLGDSRLAIDAGAKPEQAAEQLGKMTRGEDIKNHAVKRKETLREYM